MKLNVRAETEYKTILYIKLSVFVAGAIIAIPMVAITLFLNIVEFFARCYITWLCRITDTDILW